MTEVESLPLEWAVFLRACITHYHPRKGTVRRSVDNMRDEIEEAYGFSWTSQEARSIRDDMALDGWLEVLPNGAIRLAEEVVAPATRGRVDRHIEACYSRAPTGAPAPAHARPPAKLTVTDSYVSYLLLPSPPQGGEIEPVSNLPLRGRSVTVDTTDLVHTPEATEVFSRRIVKRRKSGHTRTPEAALVEAFRVEQQRTLIAKGVWVDYGPPDARALWATFKRYRKQDITPAEMEAAVLRFWGDKRWWEGSTDPWKRFVKNLPALVDLVRDPNIAEPLAPAHEDDWRNLVDRYLGPVE